MTIYLVNLDRCADRLKVMHDKFEVAGLTFVRVSAVDGMKLAGTYTKWPYELTPSEVGCILSHKVCLEMIASGEDAYGVVLEDDIDLSSTFLKYCSNFNWIPEDVDIVKIETSNEVVRVSRPIKVDDYLSLSRLLTQHLGTAGYIISRRTATEILPLLENLNVPIDRFLFTSIDGVLRRFNIFQSSPALCRQSGVTSTINQDRIEWYKKQGNVKMQVHPMKKISREVVRPLKKIKSIYEITAAKLLTRLKVGKKWKVIPFE